MGLKVSPGPNGIWRLTGTVAGQRIRRSSKTGDRAIAQQIANRIEARVWKSHLYGEEAVTTFEEAALAYMKDGGERRFLSPLIAFFRDRPLRTIRPAEIRNAARKLYPGCSGATLNRQAISPARAVVNFAHGQGWCPPIRVEGFETKPPPRSTVDADWISAFRADAFARRLPYLAAIARFMVESGARIGEVCDILPGECLPQERLVRLYDTKNGDDYDVTLSPGMAAELAALKPRRGKAFGYASRHCIYGPWRSTCRRAGIAYVPPHQAGRHSFATMLDEEGWTGAQIADAGRWKSTRLVSETYIHPKDSSRRAADLIGRKLASGESETVVSADAEKASRK